MKKQERPKSSPPELQGSKEINKRVIEQERKTQTESKIIPQGRKGCMVMKRGPQGQRTDRRFHVRGPNAPGATSWQVGCPHAVGGRENGRGCIHWDPHSLGRCQGSFSQTRMFKAAASPSATRTQSFRGLSGVPTATGRTGQGRKPTHGLAQGQLGVRSRGRESPARPRTFPAGPH